MLKIFSVEFSQTSKVFVSRAAAHGLAAIGRMNAVLPEPAHRMGMVACNLSHIEVAIDFDKVAICSCDLPDNSFRIISER